MINKPTPGELNILVLINGFIEKESWAPTIRELADLANLKAVSTVHAYVERLERKKLIEKIEASPRAMRLTESGKKEINNDFCEYCSNHFKEIKAEEQDGGIMSVACNAPGLIVEINSCESLTFEINYCPKCGKKLKGGKEQ